MSELCALQQSKMIMDSRLESLENEKKVLASNLANSKARILAFTQKIESLKVEVSGPTAHKSCLEIDAIRRKR